MKTQIVYVLVSSEKDLFLEELWASVWSLRQYEPDVIVDVVVDKPTAQRVKASWLMFLRHILQRNVLVK